MLGIRLRKYKKGAPPHYAVITTPDGSELKIFYGGKDGNKGIIYFHGDKEKFQIERSDAIKKGSKVSCQHTEGSEG